MIPLTPILSPSTRAQHRSRGHRRMSDHIKGPGHIGEQPPERYGQFRTDEDAVRSASIAGPSKNDQVLFWASFLTLIAAGIGFSVRAAILGDWSKQFGFTQTEL